MLRNYQKIRSDPLKLVLTVLQGLIALWITGIGLFLYSDQHYFFWPPDWSNIENNIRIDTFIVLVGLVLFFMHNFWREKSQSYSNPISLFRCYKPIYGYLVTAPCHHV